MKLIVGLGNPGQKYIKNYHNAGFIVVDEFLQQNNLRISKKKFNGIYLKTTINGENVIFAKPHTFMNLSGNFVFSLANYFGISLENILVIHDDKDIMINKFKYKLGGSSGGHNGIKDIINAYGTKEFSRLKIGIGTNKIQVIKDFVLSDFSKTNFNQLTNNQNIYDSINEFIQKDIKEVMNKYNEK